MHFFLDTNSTACYPSTNRNFIWLSEIQSTTHSQVHTPSLTHTYNFHTHTALLLQTCSQTYHHTPNSHSPFIFTCLLKSKDRKGEKDNGAAKDIAQWQPGEVQGWEGGKAVHVTIPFGSLQVLPRTGNDHQGELKALRLQLEGFSGKISGCYELNAWVTVKVKHEYMLPDSFSKAKRIGDQSFLTTLRIYSLSPSL